MNVALAKEIERINKRDAMESVLVQSTEALESIESVIDKLEGDELSAYIKNKLSNELALLEEAELNLSTMDCEIY